MGVAAWIQVSLNVLFFLGGVLIFIRLRKPAKEDPRLSKGLQLLQTKISILEDLSDRTDNQVRQLCSLLEQKGREVQSYIEKAEQHNQRILSSIEKSYEVANLFEDKIPHEEIIERKSSKKYIEAAKLANQGLSVSEIAKKVDLDRAEIEFIAKVNKDRLMFSEEKLPKWARIEEPSEYRPKSTDFLAKKDFSDVFSAPKVEMDAMSELGKQFRQVCEQVEEENSKPDFEFVDKLKDKVEGAISTVTNPLLEAAQEVKREVFKKDFLKDFSWEEQEVISNKIDNMQSSFSPNITNENEEILPEIDFQTNIEENMKNEKNIFGSVSVVEARKTGLDISDMPIIEKNSKLEKQDLSPQPVGERERIGLSRIEPKMAKDFTERFISKAQEFAKEKRDKGEFKNIKSGDDVNVQKIEMKPIDLNDTLS